MERRPYDFDPDKLARSKPYMITKTFYVDWSGWLEELFRKLFKKEKGNDNVGENEGSV